MARPLSVDQVDALADGFAPEPRVRAWRASDPGRVHTLPLVGGRVLSNAGDQERTTVELQVPLVDDDGTSYLPDSWGSLLVPSDCVLAVDYGVLSGFVPVARAWVDETHVVRPEGTLTVTAFSRATRVTQAGFASASRSWSGQLVDVVRAIVSDALGVAPVIVDEGVSGTVPAGTAFDGDPWQVVEQLLDAHGAEGFFDQLDQLVLRPQPTGAPPAAWAFAVGEHGTITGYDVAFTRAPNLVRMAYQDPTGAAGDVVGVAAATGDAAPAGPYGPFRTDETRTGRPSRAAADAAAAAWLARAGGMLRTVTFDAVPHPGVDVGDTISVELVGGVLELHRVTAVELPLTPGDPMRVETKATPW